jgi:hypothetical protein
MSELEAQIANSISHVEFAHFDGMERSSHPNRQLLRVNMNERRRLSGVSSPTREKCIDIVMRSKLSVLGHHRWALVSLLLWLPASPAPGATAFDSVEKAKEYVQDGLAQMGGEQTVRGIKSVRFKAIGHRNELEQSERPEGPYIVEYDQISETRDFVARGLRRTVELKVATQPKNESITIVSRDAATFSFGGRSRPGTPGMVQRAKEDLDLGPERILVSALGAPDLRAEPDTVLQSVPHHVITFTWQHTPVHVFLNANTALPTAVEWVSAYPFDTFWSVWGDVTTRVYYSFWSLTRGGLHYPLQWDVVRNGLQDQTWTIDELEVNAQIPADTFAITDVDRTDYERYAEGARQRIESDQDMRPLSDPVEFASGILHFPGPWNVTLVNQSDGIVVLEAPISSLYSMRVIAEEEKRFPGVPIKAVISTSDSWPHFGGLREYVARGVPLYIVDLNRPILTRFVEAPRFIFPDTLAKSPRAPDFRLVSRKTVVGQGPNQIEIYPLRGETSERQMMVYFPQLRLLYGSDPFQKNEDGSYFYPQTVWELVHAVQREKLAPAKFFMMHIGLTPWSELPAAIEKAESEAKTSD